MAACWLNQDQPRNKTRPWFAIASRGNKNRPKTVLQSMATKIVTKLMNWNQYRVGTLLQRVHTDCLGRKFSPQRSQYTVLSRKQGFKPAIAVSLLRLPFQNYWSEGQFWSRSFFLHKSFSHFSQEHAPFHRCSALFRRFRFTRSRRPASTFRFVERIRSRLSGTRRPALPLCAPRLAARPASFPDPFCASPILSTRRSCRECMRCCPSSPWLRQNRSSRIF